MTPAQVRHGLGKSHLVLPQNGVLDKRLVILLVHRHKHAHYIAYQVRTAFGHTIEEYRLTQTLLREIRV
jgi:hypothetical protein